MIKTFRFFTLTFLLLTLIVASPFLQNKIYAHAGGGPPFVLMNGKYAATNPLFLIAPTESGLVIPQDYAPANYQVNTPISLLVDTTQLGIDPEVAKEMTFTWEFFKGENLSIIDGKAQGVSIKKTFSQIGSYLISLSSQAPNQDAILLDTIQVNIIPTTSYTLPKSVVSVVTTLKTNASTSFENTSDEAVSYVWDFGENKIVKGKKITKTFTEEYFYSPLYARVVDKNGFITDTGVIIVGDKGKLSFSLIDTKADPSLLAVKVEKLNLALASIVTTILVVGAVLLLLRFRKSIIRR